MLPADVREQLWPLLDDRRPARPPPRAAGAGRAPHKRAAPRRAQVRQAVEGNAPAPPAPTEPSRA